MPESPPRKARIAYESGAKRSNFGRRRGDARPRRQPVRDAAAAERSPERRAFRGSGRVNLIADGENSRLGRRPRFADPLR